jgi:hypothetical protein
MESPAGQARKISLIPTEQRGGHEETCPERRRAGAVPRHSLRRKTQVLGKGERQPGEMMKQAQVGLMRCRPRRACMLAAGRASGEGRAPAGTRSRLHNMPSACTLSVARVRRRPHAAATHPALPLARRHRTDPGSWLRAQHDEQAGPEQQHCTSRGRPQREPCAPFVTFRAPPGPLHPSPDARPILAPRACKARRHGPGHCSTRTPEPSGRVAQSRCAWPRALKRCLIRAHSSHVGILPPPRSGRAVAAQRPRCPGIW